MLCRHFTFLFSRAPLRARSRTLWRSPSPLLGINSSGQLSLLGIPSINGRGIHKGYEVLPGGSDGGGAAWAQLKAAGVVPGLLDAAPHLGGNQLGRAVPKHLHRADVSAEGDLAAAALL